MATNSYIKKGTSSEKNLVEDLVVETIKFYGYDIQYLPREFVNKDYLFGEDVLNKFVDSYEIEMYLETVDGFEGDGKFLEKFGLEIRDTAKFKVAQKRFQNVVTNVDSTIKRPREGDLLYFPLSEGLFEITYVSHKDPFFQLGKNFVYTLTVELFEYSNEKLDTGINAIDGLIGSDLLNSDDLSNEAFADNDEIETEADGGIVDFTENNPFGSF